MMNKREMLSRIIGLSIFFISLLLIISAYRSNIQAETITETQKITPASVSAETSAQSLPAIQKTSRETDEATKSKVLKTYSKLPIYFIANQGQTDDKVNYYTKGSGYSFFFTKDEVVYSFVQREKGAQDIRDGKAQKISLTKCNDEAVKSQVIRLKFIGANPDVEVKGTKKEEAKVNYLVGKDSSKWHTNIPTYSEITYKDIYKGIDIVYKGSPSKLKSEFIVNPGADPNDIKLAYNDINSLTLSDAGDLIIRTSFGEMREEKPRIYQVIDGKEIEVKGRYVIDTSELKDKVFAFSLEPYNRSYPLIIDPTLDYSTYLGGSSNDEGWSIAVDSSGNAYVTGDTFSTDFPTQNAYDSSYNGSADVFITKLNASGNALVYSTYLGGSLNDRGHGIKVDLSENAYLTGFTNSNDFPTLNAYDSSHNGLYDVFITKLNASGNALVYSTYLGDINDEAGQAIALDSGGNAYVTGVTESSSFPTLNAYDSSHNGLNDVFITKLNASGNALVYSTYLGGSDYEAGTSIALDSGGNAYVTGVTESSNFPTLNAYDSSYNGGVFDVFITKLNASGNALVYSTYLGGSGPETGLGIAVDSSGNAYVTGNTFSTDFPTQNAYQNSLSSSIDAFVTKLNTSGNALVYSTYLGGNNGEKAFGIALDSFGNAYVTGFTFSSNFPTVNAYQNTWGGNDDIFVTKLNASGNALIYSTYLGGVSSEFGRSIALDFLGYGIAYITGTTWSADFPIKNAYQSSNAGVSDVFVLKLGDDADRDDIPDYSDNCPANYNSDQKDTDSDGIGDVCDNCPSVDNGPVAGTCTAGSIGSPCVNSAACGVSGFCSLNQEDTDGDGLGDACDNPPIWGINEIMTGVPSYPVRPGEPIWIKATFKNTSAQDIDTIQPDCYNTFFMVTKKSTGEVLPTKCRIPNAYGIPTDVRTIKAGKEFSVLCDLTEMYPSNILTSGSPITYSVTATYANFITDPDIVGGVCTSTPCSNLWTGAVSAPSQDITIDGISIVKKPAQILFNPAMWDVNWASPPITASISNIEGHSVHDVNPWSILLNGTVGIRSYQFRGEVLDVVFDGGEAVRSLGTAVPGTTVYPTVEGGFNSSYPDEIFYGQGRVDLYSVLSGVVVMQPNGGEVLPSGSTYSIIWGAEPAAVKFAVGYSCTPGIWTLIASNVTSTNYDWVVPAPLRNENNCRVGVRGYNASGGVVATDISDNPFTIEVLKVTSPNGGEVIPGGCNTFYITWHTNMTVSPVAKTMIYGSANGGATWKLITVRPGNTGSYLWITPWVDAPKTSCRIGVVLKDALGNTLGKDASDANFTIQP